MFAVIFEAHFIPGAQPHYRALAADLKPLLSHIDGFISVERFQSLTQPEKILSLSLWRDEEALKAWREHPEHCAAQQVGYQSIFSDYRLRVVQVVRDYGKGEQHQAPGEKAR